MSDQGELAGRRGTSSDETNDAEVADRPARPNERVSAFRGQGEGAGDATRDAGADPADHAIFRVRRRPPADEDDADPQVYDSVSTADADPGPEASVPGSSVSEPSVSEPPATAWSGSEPPAAGRFAAEPYRPRRSASQRPSSGRPYGDDIGDHAAGGPGAADRAAAGRAFDQRVAGEPSGGPGQALDEGGGEPDTARPGWERSLFDDSGMDSGPGDPRYAPVDMSGPSTPPKPGTPSSGNLRLPDWMKQGAEAEIEDDAAGGKPKARAPRPQGDEDGEGTSHTALYAGVGLLLIAILAAIGVYLLRSADDTDSAPAPANGGEKKTAASREPNPRQVAVSLPPDRPLKRFSGTPSRVIGRITDTHAGLSYPHFGAPWVLPTKQNKLGQLGWSGQQVVVTEHLATGQVWYGQLLSGTLSPGDQAAYNSGGTPREAAAAVAQNIEGRAYAFQHTSRPYASQALDVDGHKGWLVATAIHYHRTGVRATAELVVVAVIDTGRKDPAVLFLAVPNTHQKLWPDVNALLQNLHVVA